MESHSHLILVRVRYNRHPRPRIVSEDAERELVKLLIVLKFINSAILLQIF